VTKLRRDARAFAQRVQMGSRRLWVLVEGRAHDRPFYDRLLQSHTPSVSQGFTVRLAEQIELRGKSAGGKDFLLSLFDFFREESLLVQENKEGKRYIALALDRDFDNLAGLVIESPHLMYTRTADVEAEILVHGDVRRAISSAYSLTGDAVARVLPEEFAFASELARRWRDWITYGVVAVCCGVQHEVRYAHHSNINTSGFGALDESAAEALRSKIEGALFTNEARERLSAARAEVDDYYEQDREWLLVKGKWIASFIWFLVSQALDEIPREKVQAETVVKTCLETIDFRAAWADPYRAHLDRLLAA